jgi:catechol 2,3-dioxygenase-like lactoylglutathione lyase family enzyme
MRASRSTGFARTVGRIQRLRAKRPLCNTSAVLRFGVVVIGVEDRERAAAFWEQALGYRRRSEGFGGWAVVLEPTHGAGARLALQISETPPPTDPRIHFDLHAEDARRQAAEVERLVALGAKRVDWPSYPEDPDFVVLSDPDGNLFCVVNLGYPD